MTDTLALDFTHAARALRRGPMATAIAMLTLALGVGANTAVLSVFESILVRPLPYPRADRLVAVAQADGMRAGDISPWVARTIEEQSTTIDAVGLYTDGQWVMTGEGDAEVFRGQRVSAGFFETLGVRPLLGRVFTRDEDGAPRASVVVLTSELWTTRFGADPGVVGRLVTLNGSPYRIIGVLGREFEPLRMTNPAEEPRIFAPLGYNAVAAAQCRNCASLHGVARLAGDASPARARAELAGMFRRLHDQYPADFGPDAGMQIEPLKDRLTGPLRTALWLALAAGACVLLIAFANLAGLLLARASARTAEFALRGALGSSRARTVRQLLFESGIIAAGGCAAGLLLARGGVAAVAAMAPRELPRLHEIAVDRRVLLTAIALGILTAIAAGLAPAWLSWRTDLNDALKRQAARHGGSSGSRARAALVVAEVSLAFVLIAATGLLVKTMDRLLRVDAGFDAAHVLTMTPVMLAGPDEAVLVEKRRMIDAVLALPQVEAAGMVNDVPLSHTVKFPCAIEGQDADARSPARPDVFWIEGAYLQALRIPLRRGRLFTRDDGVTTPPAVLVSEAFARLRFPGADPLGHRIRLADGPWLTIVGIVGDVKNEALDRPVGEAVYQPLALNPNHYIRIAARTAGDPWRLERPIRAAVRAIDPLVPIFHVQPMDDYLASSVARRRFALTLISTFGLLALVLAAIGQYGLLAYAVTLRTPELGIRAALGATKRNLMRLVMTSGLALSGAGVLIGLVLSIAATRTMQSLLFGVSAADMLTLAGASVVLAATGAIACAVPARRAARIDPLEAMRLD